MFRYSVLSTTPPQRVPRLDNWARGRGQNFRSTVTLSDQTGRRLTLSVRILNTNEKKLPTLAVESEEKCSAAVAVKFKNLNQAVQRVAQVSTLYFSYQSFHSQLKKQGFKRDHAQEIIRQVSVGDWSRQIYTNRADCYMQEGIFGREGKTSSGKYGSVEKATIQGKAAVVKVLNNSQLITQTNLQEATAFKVSKVQDKHFFAETYGAVLKIGSRFIYVPSKKALNAVCKSYQAVELDSLVMEDGGKPLNEHLSKMDATELIFVFRDLLHGLKNIHDTGYVHHDIKPDNLLYNEDRGLKIVDFGFAKKIDPRQQTISYRGGTPNYQAPESSQAHNQKVDVFSAGVTFLDFLSKFDQGVHLSFNESLLLVHGLSNYYRSSMLQQQIQIALESAGLDEYFAEGVSNLVRDMLNQEPELRPDSTYAFSQMQRLIEQLGQGLVDPRAKGTE